MDTGSKQLYEEQAVRNSQRLIAYTAKMGKSVDDETLRILTSAAEKLGTEEWTPDFNVEFWKAFTKISQIISPATVDSVRAICFEPKPKGFRGVLAEFFGRSAAQRTSKGYTIFTLFIMLVLLIFQVYWVVGNTLEIKLTELLNTEKSLTGELYKNQQDLSELELLYKTKEIEAMGLQIIQRDYTFTFYSTPEWEREKLQIELDIHQLDNELESIRAQLDRNRFVLLYWSGPWKEIIIPEDSQGVSSESDSDDLWSKKENLFNQIKTLENEINQDPNASNVIKEKKAQREALKNQLDVLQKEASNDETGEQPNKDLIAIIQADYDKVSQELANEEGLRKQIVAQRNITLQELKDQYNSLLRYLERVRVKEESQRARLGASFVIVILESYILPVLYALLGASAYVLRTMEKEIKSGIFSEESSRGYALRLALGALAGLMVGWFVFLLPGQTFLVSISPLAIAFLVGYNIEILFSWMDAFIRRFSKTDKNGSDLQDEVDNSAV